MSRRRFDLGGRRHKTGLKAMLHVGENTVRGLPVAVERKRIRRINLRIAADGRVCLSVPARWSTLREGEAFLLSKWNWVVGARERLAARPRPEPVTPDGARSLASLLGELMDAWTRRLAEPDVTWRLRRMRSLWGSCHFRSRHVVFSVKLAHAPRELVEYVVVHELTHLRAHDHGPSFRALMDARLPDWQGRRRRLNRREFAAGGAGPSPAAPCPVAAPHIVQPEFFF